MDNVQLILVSHHLCPYVQRAAIALAEKGIPVERRFIDLAAKPAWFQAISPLGKVPLLIVRQPDGKETVIFESAVICEYLEDAFPQHPLHPANALARARHRAWIEFGSAILGDLWGYETAKDETLFKSKQQALRQKFERAEAELSDGPYFAGPAFSMVDAVFAPIFRYFETFQRLDEQNLFEDMPKLQAWRAALAVRPSVAGAVGPDYPQRLLAFLEQHDAHLLKLAA